MRCFKSVVSLALALFLTLPLLAQVKIRGRVLDGSTPVTGAMAGAKGGLSKVMSGDDGRFVLNVSPGATVEVSSFGYKSVKAVIPKNASGTLAVEFRMDKGKAVISQAKDEPVAQAPAQVQPRPQVPQQQSSLVRTQKTHEKSGFTWTEVKSGELIGVEVNGKTVVPIRYNYIEYSPGYFDVSIFGNPMISACYTKDGTCIIPESRGYNSLSSYMASDEGYIHVTKDGKAGACDTSGKEVISPSLGYEQISFNRNQPDFCTVKKGGTWGLYSLWANMEIIPPSFGYTNIALWGMKDNSLDVYKGDKVGRFDIVKQKEIIPVGRYDSIYRGDSDGVGFYYVKKDGKEGACIRDGREVVPPQYESLLFSSGQFCYKSPDGSWYDLGIDINGNKVEPKNKPSTSSYSSSRTSSSSSSSVSSSSGSYSSSSSSSASSTSSTSSSSTSTYSSSSSQSSQYGSLLFGGTYTCNGKTIQDLQIVQTANVFICDLQIYEKILVYNKNEYFYYAGNQVLFELNFRKYVDSKNQTFFVHEGGALVYYAIYNTQFVPFVGNVTSVTYVMFEKGDTRAQQPVGGGYVPQGGVNTGGGAVNTGTVCPICRGQKICTNPGSPYNYKEYCQGSRRCANCSGSGHVPAGFGQSGYVPCSYCNRRVNNNYGDGICGRCHGTGLCHRCGGRGYL